jgi:Na+-translocating ferredoxin:NAD+ oxidoreductase RnfC subunit
MITLTKLETIDKASYNSIHCTHCNDTLGWKLKATKVHPKRLSRKASKNQEHILLTCDRCKSNYRLTTD